MQEDTLAGGGNGNNAPVRQWRQVGDDRNKENVHIQTQRLLRGKNNMTYLSYDLCLKVYLHLILLASSTVITHFCVYCQLGETDRVRVRGYRICSKVQNHVL